MIKLMMYLRTLGGILLLDCILYYVLRLLLGRRRRIAGAISLWTLGIVLVAVAIGLLGMSFRPYYKDELQVFQALYKGLIGKGTAYISGLSRPGKTVAQWATFIGMAVMVLLNLTAVGFGAPLLMGGLFDPQDEGRTLSFVDRCTTFYPVTLILFTLGFAVIMALNMVVCIGVYWLLHGAWPW